MHTISQLNQAPQLQATGSVPPQIKDSGQTFPVGGTKGANAGGASGKTGAIGSGPSLGASTTSLLLQEQEVDDVKEEGHGGGHGGGGGGHGSMKMVGAAEVEEAALKAGETKVRKRRAVKDNASAGRVKGKAGESEPGVSEEGAINEESARQLPAALGGNWGW